MADPNNPFSASIIRFDSDQMRAFAEKGISQARDSYEAVFTKLSEGASEYSSKLMEMMKSNTTANLNFAQELLAIRSPSEALELWTSHTRKQYEAFTVQAKELGELTQKIATHTAEPIKASALKPAA
jgi:phasin